MKIRVFTIRDVIKYLIKIGAIFGVIAILTNFFYSKKNVNCFFSFNSGKLLSVLQSEILIVRNMENKYTEFNKEKYITSTIGKELSMFKTVAVSNISEIKNIQAQRDLTKMSEDENKESTEKDTINNNPDEQLQEAKIGLVTEVIPSSIQDKSTYEIFGVKIRNESDYNLENEITDLDINYNKQDIIIFHTHTCESYTPTEEYQYDSIGNYRTTDLNFTVARVGDELEKYLTNYGYTVVHDKSYHDYPAYNGSYNRSLVTVQNLLEKYSNTDVVIDLHRDAIGDNTYAPKVKIGDEYCARIMLVIGTDGGGLSHDNWRENVKFAIKLVQKANELYPRFV